MIAIVDYNTGNLQSVRNAVRRLGFDCMVTADHDAIRSASHVILPGVGEAAYAMRQLRERQLHSLVPALSQPVLGICIGMQIMCRLSEEGHTRCLGIFPTVVRRLEADLAIGLKIPHMGWDRVHVDFDSPLFSGIPQDAFLYYVHSYAADLCGDTVATTHCGRRFSAVLHSRNFYGVQFHPEKSAAIGAKILYNFLTL